MYNVLFFIDIYNHCGYRTILTKVVKVLIIYEVRVASSQKKTTHASSYHTCIEAMHHPYPNSECKIFLWIFVNTNPVACSMESFTAMCNVPFMSILHHDGGLLVLSSYIRVGYKWLKVAETSDFLPLQINYDCNTF
jgi:hypothetical protein